MSWVAIANLLHRKKPVMFFFHSSLQSRQARQAREYLGQSDSVPPRRVTSSDIVGHRREPPQSPSMKMLNLTYSFDRPDGKQSTELKDTG